MITVKYSLCPKKHVPPTFYENALPFPPTSHAAHHACSVASPRAGRLLRCLAACSVASPPAPSPRHAPSAFSPSSRRFSSSTTGDQEGRDPLFCKARDLPAPAAALKSKDTEVWIKWDDLAGMQLSGNKARKLEFLVADAVARGADCVVTAGGIQSNHCRATAVAAKYAGLCTSKLLVDQDPGLEEGRRPYVVPAGGSNALRNWGYIEAVREIEEQIQLSGGDVVASDDDDGGGSS